MMLKFLLVVFVLVGCSPKPPTSDMRSVQDASRLQTFARLPFEITYGSKIAFRMTADGKVTWGYTESRMDDKSGEVTTKEGEKDWIRVLADGKVTTVDGVYVGRLMSDGRVLDFQDNQFASIDADGSAKEGDRTWSFGPDGLLLGTLPDRKATRLVTQDPKARRVAMLVFLFSVRPMVAVDGPNSRPQSRPAQTTQ
jgi:hypothetical protein